MRNSESMHNTDRQVHLTLIQQKIDRRDHASLWVKGISGAWLFAQPDLADTYLVLGRNWVPLVVALGLAIIDLIVVQEQGLLQKGYDSIRKPGCDIDFSLDTPNPITSDIEIDLSFHWWFFVAFHALVLGVVAGPEGHLIETLVFATLFVSCLGALSSARRRKWKQFWLASLVVVLAVLAGARLLAL